MSVKIRMKRVGRTNRAHFRINAVDTRASRDGRVIEELGSYDPHAPDDRKVRLDLDRVRYWLSVGAQPSDTVRTFLKKAGLFRSAPTATPAAAPAEAAAPKPAAAAPEAEFKPADDETGPVAP